MSTIVEAWDSRQAKLPRCRKGCWIKRSASNARKSLFYPEMSHTPSCASAVHPCAHWFCSNVRNFSFVQMQGISRPHPLCAMPCDAACCCKKDISAALLNPIIRLGSRLTAQSGSCDKSPEACSIEAAMTLLEVYYHPYGHCAGKKESHSRDETQ